jgi:hypothetical protein
MINDYVVQRSTANHNNVVSQLMRHATNSLAIQNQASHLTFNPMSPEGRAAGAPTRRSLVQGTTKKAPWHTYGVCAGIWFD